AGILYWFHPLVRLALQKLHLSQELACDLAVLNHLPTSECTAYGRTLLHFTASRTMQHHFFYSGLADRDSQLKQRIHQIASYHPLTFPQKCRNAFILLTAVCFFISAAPFLSLQAAGAPVEDGIFLPEPSVTELKVSSLFQERDGSFVFYDPQTEHWQIYNRELAARRSSPDSTYKIYSALAALQEGVITPEDSSRQWDRTEHFFAAWNQDQTLRSAMQYSVNWYFQNLDRSTGYASLSRFFRRIGYGNQDLSGGLSSFWLESSLQISPQEQVLLLKDFYQNTWGLPQKQIDTVKDSLYLTEYHGRRLYGKTGTGIKDGKEINGWFIGFTETDADVYFFAVNLQASDNASGQTAGEIALSYLQEMGL
ncbi:MAG TPA: BlaR1 family beta-lactam sensor/signal transducer, partial [Lachnospiraceae bacterium]|nr:BlaR1 family beta-lactam sensor/signal transducer [Lachnospiraceae bacterium]